MSRSRVCVVFALLIAGCNQSRTDNLSNVYRAVDSPDGAATARLARTASGGAAGSLVYDVYLSKNGSGGGAELVFHGYSDCNPEIQWRGSQLLVIRYAGWKCQVQSFHSFWQERELERVEMKLPRVEVMLERVPPDVSDVWNPQ